MFSIITSTAIRSRRKTVITHALAQLSALVGALLFGGVPTVCKCQPPRVRVESVELWKVETHVLFGWRRGVERELDRLHDELRAERMRPRTNPNDEANARRIQSLLESVAELKGRLSAYERVIEERIKSPVGPRVPVAPPQPPRVKIDPPQPPREKIEQPKPPREKVEGPKPPRTKIEGPGIIPPKEPTDKVRGPNPPRAKIDFNERPAFYKSVSNVRVQRTIWRYQTWRKRYREAKYLRRTARPNWQTTSP